MTRKNQEAVSPERTPRSLFRHGAMEASPKDQRRLEACRLLDWTDVPVTVVDLYQAARGEAHENFVRKDLLPSEIVALKRA